MKVAAEDPGGRPIILFPIHYEVPESVISLETFQSSAENFVGLVDGSNKELFQSNLQFKIYVLPPSAGTFTQKLGMAVIAGGSFVAGAVLTGTIGDFGKGIIEGIVGRDLEDWGRNIGGKVTGMTHEDEDRRITVAGEPRPILEHPHVEDVIAAGILTELSENFLKTPNHELRSVGVTPEVVTNCFAAKSDMYRGFELNPNISAVSFGDEPGHEIPREEFQRYTSLYTEEDPKEWRFQTLALTITSPNWDQGDKQRGWKGIDKRGEKVFFQMADKFF